MATNGTGESEALQNIERAITGIGNAAPARRDAAPNENSIATFVEDLAEQYRALGRHSLEHGQYLSQLLNEHADKLLSDNRRVTSLVLQAERKLVADAENFIGK
jgi:hypothetical protein